MRIVLILVCATLLTGCGSGPGATGRTSVVAAFYPLAFAAERIGGAHVHVENLTPPGAEPHDLELAPKAVARIESADVVLYLSHGFQPAVSDAVRQARGMKVDILSGLPLHANVGGEQGLTADPHVWLDPVLFARVVRRIGTALDNAKAAAALSADLRRLDHAYRTGLAHCARTAVLDPIEGLTPAEQARGENYLSLMRQNLAALRKALSCR